MNKYHKIQTVFFRDPNNNHKTLLDGVFSKPEFELLQNIDWEWTEKIDGTNIRIIWENGIISFKGKTEDAQIPTYLYDTLQSIFPIEKFQEHFPTTALCLYGEGFWNKIQKVGKNYLPDSNSFILFDVTIGDFWLDRSSVYEIANKLSISHVPVIGHGPLRKALELVESGFPSTISDKELVAEGLILRPPIELYNKKGDRIITKIKHRDF